MKRILFSLVLVAVAGLTACQKEADVKPIILQATPTGARLSAPSHIIAGPQKRLLSDGGITLSYAPDGRLKTYTSGQFNAELTYLSASAADLYPGYKPAKGIRLQGIFEGKPTQWTLYYLLDAEGVCQRLVLTAPDGTHYFQYTYNAKGQLMAVSQPAIQLFWGLLYDEQDQLSRVRVFRKGKMDEETILSYKSANGSIQPNKLGHYADVSLLNFHYFRYLPIFGKSGNFLVQREKTTKVLTGETTSDFRLDYTLDPDGYIKTRATTNLLTNKTGQPMQHTYEVINSPVE
ncbi:hypothetical protein [Spirosoma sp. KNUC1025]|uniref:hypothetical protein n=1 Tax=Spirosoma sp. KNUC1025 TaxID=2894082 RepID=UPI001E2C102A|nr:hypothetical protein [Spirosoma sp. KNUC1025]UFH57530.1 hypothetical protein LN737_30980 [Spirosoma sp. KNUC1025]